MVYALTQLRNLWDMRGWIQLLIDFTVHTFAGLLITATLYQCPVNAYIANNNVPRTRAVEFLTKITHV